MWIISLIGKKNLIIIGAVLILIIGYLIQINRLENRIEHLEGRVALLTSQLEACQLRENGAYAAIQKQNENIAWYEEQMLASEESHKLKIAGGFRRQPEYDPAGWLPGSSPFNKGKDDG